MSGRERNQKLARFDIVGTGAGKETKPLLALSNGVSSHYCRSKSDMAAVLRAVFGYCFLILMVRVVGRRPGKQLTPFEFVLIFFIGGLTLTGMVGDEVSFTNALCQIITIAMVHYAIVWARAKSPKLARLLDGTPLVLLEKGQWRTNTLSKMRIQDDDVMASARDNGLERLDEIDYAVLERNGEISIIPAQKAS